MIDHDKVGNICEFERSTIYLVGVEEGCRYFVYVVECHSKVGISWSCENEMVVKVHDSLLLGISF